MTRPELELLHGYLNGKLNADDFARLQTLLRTNGEARRMLRTLSTVEAKLEQLAADSPATLPRALAPTHEAAQTTLGMAWSRLRSWRPLAPAAALALVLIGAAWIAWVRGPVNEPLARLVATTNARWSDPNVELALSSGELTPGPLRLESGRAEFLLLDGATVVIKGPASVRFADRKLVSVDEGRVYCQCPTPQSRISVITPQTKVVDLGTEFSVEARADQSTHVAVLSGKVEVQSPNAGVLTAGEAMDVRKNHVVRLKPLSREEMVLLMPSLVSSPSPPADAARNLLVDPGFESPLPSPLWRGSDEFLEHAAGLGRSGHAVRIRAKGHKFWPLVKQTVATGDISGKVVDASVWAMSAVDDPLTDRQYAVLKLAFLNAEGREFASSAQHFLHKGAPAGHYSQSHLAAQAPPGTRAVELQLLLNACGMNYGSVCFDDAMLVIAEQPIAF
ncbi:MAG: hypothetical protein EBS05_06455 [Proteobacteria bacterium]|nr:hypothetical protein [Pseudomonadota bacterium]